MFKFLFCFLDTDYDAVESSSINTSLSTNTSNVVPKLRINLTNLNNAAQTNTISSSNANNASLPHYGLEEQFILRLPPSLASILNSELAENEYTSPGDLSIKFVSGRTAIVKHPRFIKDAYPAVLMDSPTVMETLKNSTLSVMEITRIEDKEGEEDTSRDTSDPFKSANAANSINESEINVGQYYKVADLNQILMVLDLDTQEGQRIFNRVPQALQEQLLQEFHIGHLRNITASWAQLQDGLTPPMKSARQRRFAPRPLHASNVGDMERIEKELERLLKSDGQAIESKFSLIGATGEILLGDSDFVDAKAEGEDVEMTYEESVFDQNEENDYEEEEAENEEEDEEVSSASDIEDMNDFAAEIEDNLLTLQPETGKEQKEPEEVEKSFEAPAVSETDRLVKDLEAKLAEKLKQAESVSNPLIKARIEDVIKQLEDNLKNLRERE